MILTDCNFSEKPDVVYLQEVVLKNLAVVKDQLTGYIIILGFPGGLTMGNGDYFTAVLLRKDTAKYLSHSVTPFSSSIMCRTLLRVDVGFNMFFQYCIFSIKNFQYFYF